MSGDTETLQFGDYFSAAQKNRITPVEYGGSRYEVREQYWSNNESDGDPVWCVGVHLDEPKRTDTGSVESLVRNLQTQIAKIEVLRRLDYEFESMSDNNYVIFQKPADASGLKVEE